MTVRPLAFARGRRPVSPPRRHQPSVVIIGGGLAGVGAVHRLRRRLGSDVHITLLEARERPGGRVHSLPGSGEAGCEPPFFHRGPMLHMAEDLGIPIRSYRGSALSLGYHIDGHWVAAAEWPRFAQRRYPAPFDRLSPFRAWFPLTARFAPPPGWDDDPVRALAQVDPQLMTMSVAQLLENLHFPPELQPLVPALFHVFESPHRMSALSALMRGWSARPDGTFYYFDGPMRRVVDIAMQLPDAVDFGCLVTSVTRTYGGHHRVTAEDGRTWIADQVIFAIPAHRVARIDVDPGWPVMTRQALDRCRYGPVVKVFFRTHQPLSALDGLPDVMMADRGFDACFPIYDPRTRETPTRGPDVRGLELVFVGDRARQLLAVTQRGGSIAEHARATLVAARPAAAACARVEHTAVWTASGGPGALPYFSPRADIPQLLAALQRPFGPLHLAGDYTEVRYAGWDGAVASGQRAADQVAEALRVNRSRRRLAGS